MRDDVIQVRPEGLRRCATDLADVGRLLGHGLHHVPALTLHAPGWAAAQELNALESAVHAYLGSTGGRAADLAAGLRAAATEYEAVDERAAQRLRRTG